MKIVSEEEVKEHNRATVRGALEGSLGSAAVAIPGFWYLNRRWPYYRSLPIQLKVLGVVIIVAPCLSIQAERRGLQYDKSRWTGAGKMELDREAAVEEAKWSALSMKDRVAEWAATHQYSIILGGWATGLAVASSIIFRKPYQTMGQKVVQVRMWAQGLTIGLIIVGGVLTHARREEAAKHRTEDHSWRNLLEEQQREAEARKVKALPSAA